MVIHWLIFGQLTSLCEDVSELIDISVNSFLVLFQLVYLVGEVFDNNLVEILLLHVRELLAQLIKEMVRLLVLARIHPSTLLLRLNELEDFVKFGILLVVSLDRQVLIVLDLLVHVGPQLLHLAPDVDLEVVGHSVDLVDGCQLAVFGATDN